MRAREQTARDQSSLTQKRTRKRTAPRETASTAAADFEQPTFVGRALVDVLSPIRLRVGEILVCWPHASSGEALIVTDPTGESILRSAPWTRRENQDATLLQMKLEGVFA